MKTISSFIGIGVALSLLAAPPPSQSQVISSNIVGYVNTTFAPGQNLFGNPLLNGGNTLSSLFVPGVTPNGTTISLWDPVTASYNQSSTFNGSTWSINLTLNLGVGALLTTPAQFTNTFVGNAVIQFDLANNPVPLVTPTGGNGIYLLSSISPIGFPAGGFSTFDSIIGRAPHNGERFTWLDELTQTYYTTTYNSALGQWDNGAPTLAVGEAAFFNIGPVPEPTGTALFIVGLATLTLLRHRRSESSP